MRPPRNANRPPGGKSRQAAVGGFDGNGRHNDRRSPSKRQLSPLEIAAQIEQEHAAATGAARTAIEHAVACGKLLIEAKASVEHGNWLPWVEQHLSFGDRQARKYMRVAQHADQIGLENSDLTIDDALAVIAEPRPTSAQAAVVTRRFDQALVILKRMKAVAAAAEAGDLDALRQVIADANRVATLCQQISSGTLVGFSPDAAGPLVEITGTGGEYVWLTTLVNSEVVGMRRPVRANAVDHVMTAIGIEARSLSWQFVPGAPPIGLRQMLVDEAAP